MDNAAEGGGEVFGENLLSGVQLSSVAVIGPNSSSLHHRLVFLFCVSPLCNMHNTVNAAPRYAAM